MTTDVTIVRRAKTRRMSILDWVRLPQDSKRRAVMHCLPMFDDELEEFIAQRPNFNDERWRTVFKCVLIPLDSHVYKTVVNQVYVF